MAVFDGFYRAGSLVFGGGHVVLPLLRSEVVSPGWVERRRFPRGLRRRPGRPRPPVHLCRLPRDGDPDGDPRLDRRRSLRCSPYSCRAGSSSGAPTRSGTSSAGRPGRRPRSCGADAAVVGILLAALYRPVCTRGDQGRARRGRRGGRGQSCWGDCGLPLGGRVRLWPAPASGSSGDAGGHGPTRYSFTVIRFSTCLTPLISLASSVTSAFSVRSRPRPRR